jgi:hypothetical protein
MKEMIRVSFLKRLFFVVLLLVLLFLFNSCDTNSNKGNNGQVSPIEYKTIVIYFLDGDIDTINCVKWYHSDDGSVRAWNINNGIVAKCCYVKYVKEIK